MRLNKFLASCGVSSRRKCDELIFSGKVMVNGKIVKTPAYQVNPEKDEVIVNENIVKLPQKIYIALNKPEGVLCSLKDDFGRTLIIDLIPEIKERIFPVGRLDYNSEGLILLTNDGELSNRLIHPKFKVEKTYHVLIKGNIDEYSLKQLSEGIEINGEKTQPAKIKILNIGKKTTFLEIIIKEGKKRQIRRMLKEVGYEVKKLRRVKFGPIKLGKLKKGEWRYLTKKEVEILYKITMIEK